MTWNNRIIERELKASNGITLLYGLHETYYNGAGLVTSYTSESVAGYYESVDEMIATLEKQLADAKRCREKRDIIVEKGFIFAAEDNAPDEALTPAEADRVAAVIQIEIEQQQPLREQILGEIQKSTDTAHEFIAAPVSSPISNKLFYAQHSRMDDSQIGAMNALAEAGRMCCLICDGSVIGWIDREKVHLLPNLNVLVLNQPRPLIGKCPKCQGVEWRYMGCYALDEFDAQNGFECMGCRSRQYDCFQYRKNPDQSASRATGEAQDSEAGSQLGSPS